MLRTASSYLPALNANERFAAFASAPPNPRRSSTPISSSLASTASSSALGRSLGLLGASGSAGLMSLASLGSRASGSARPALGSLGSNGPRAGGSGSPLLAPPMWSAKGSISCVLLRSVEPCAVHKASHESRAVCRHASLLSRFLL